MRSLRLLVLLIFAVAADLSTPLVPEAAEEFEEFEEAAHRKRGRRYVRRVGEAAIPATARVTTRALSEAPRRATESVRPVDPVAAPRKAPPPAAHRSSASPEDH